jgi:hypothetical protein
VRGWLGYSGGVVAEAGASVNGEATGREAVGGERVGDGMGETMVLTGGPELPVEEWCERERGGAADWWAGLSGAARARAAGPLGSGRRGGRKAGATRFGPKTAQPRGKGFSFFFFCFLFHFSIFYFCFFLFPFLLNQQFAK